MGVTAESRVYFFNGKFLTHCELDVLNYCHFIRKYLLKIAKRMCFGISKISKICGHWAPPLGFLIGKGYPT